MADTKEKAKAAPKADKELKPNPKCPVCKGKGFVELAGGTYKINCTCKYK